MTRSPHNVPVLMYHHVSPSTGSLTTSPENFHAQMSWLRWRGWTTLTAEQFSDYLAGGSVPPKSVLLTFDDGYLDNYVYAHPTLQAFGLNAVMFLVTGWANEGPTRPHAGHARDHDAVVLPDTPDHAQCKALVAEGRTDEVIVRWSEVHAMQAAATFEFHSHTHTHTRWDKLFQDPVGKRAALAGDLAASKHALQMQLGGVSDHLCWPQGYFDDDYVAAAQEAGFRVLYTTDARGHNTPDQSPAHIYRVAVKNKGGMLFGNRLWLAQSPRIGAFYNALKKKKT